MSVTDSADNKGWGQNSNWESNSNGTNQWLVNNNNQWLVNNSNNDKVCVGSWAQAVSGGDSSSSSNSNIPNNKLSSNQNELIEENGSQNNQNITSSHFNFDDLNDLYSTKWGKSVINHDNKWESIYPTGQSPSSAKDNGLKPFEQMRNNGCELWENNLRQTKELNNSELMQSPNVQQPIEQTDTQWKKLVSTTSHFGGTWGEEEDLSNVWTGIPNNTASVNSNNQQLTNSNNQTSTSINSNVFRQTQNSINSAKSNLQLLPNNSNKNRISEDNENWGESIKTGTEWDASAQDISILNSNSVLTSPKNEASVPENWNPNYFPNKSVASNPAQSSSGWTNDPDKANTTNSTDANVDDGTSLWGNPQQGQNKVLLWKEEENKQRNGQKAINNQQQQQWKKYSLNQANNGNKRNWDELIALKESLDNRNSVPGTPIASNSILAWNNSIEDSDWAKNNKSKLTKEMIASSSPYRILVDMGFKEEDVENSLRNSNMNLQESIEELRLNTLKETGIEIDRRKQQAQNSPVQGLPSANNILRNISSKLPNSANNLPSEKLLSHFIQQIQLAVQHGHLSPTILSQQLAPATVTSIYQLLQQIKIMQNFQAGNGGVPKNYFQNSYQINQCKNKIAAIQKQINAQQALFFKQQMQATGRTSGTMMNNNNNIGNLANDLNNLQLNQQNQSRLNQWKLLPNSDDTLNYQDAVANDFSRAPGCPSTKQPPQQFVLPNSWTNMNANDENNWQNNLTHSKDVNNQLSSSAPQQLITNNYGEIVTDFNTNKQWKDTMQQMNNNPQAYCAGIGEVKDQMYNWSTNKLGDNNDNLANTSNTFNSSTWSFQANSNAQPQQQQLQTATPQNANIWNNNSAVVSKIKGPPPGLASQIKDQNTGFLLIRNLTLQIDESILKTLCRQHGSLLFFHVFLNHGIAIVKYSNKDEAIKAQSALNNCSLSNTTIQVNLASETEVQQYLTNCQQAVNNSSIYTNNVGVDLNNFNSLNNEYMIAANSGATWQPPQQTHIPNTSSNMWSFNNNQTPNLWNIDQNSNNALQNLLPDNLLEST